MIERKYLRDIWSLGNLQGRKFKVHPSSCSRCSCCVCQVIFRWRCRYVLRVIAVVLFEWILLLWGVQWELPSFLIECWNTLLRRRRVIMEITSWTIQRDNICFHMILRDNLKGIIAHQSACVRGWMKWCCAYVRRCTLMFEDLIIKSI